MATWLLCLFILLAVPIAPDLDWMDTVYVLFVAGGLLWLLRCMDIKEKWRRGYLRHVIPLAYIFILTKCYFDPLLPWKLTLSIGFLAVAGIKYWKIEYLKHAVKRDKVLYLVVLIFSTIFMLNSFVLAADFGEFFLSIKIELVVILGIFQTIYVCSYVLDSSSSTRGIRSVVISSCVAFSLLGGIGLARAAQNLAYYSRVQSSFELQDYGDALDLLAKIEEIEGLVQFGPLSTRSLLEGMTRKLSIENKDYRAYLALGDMASSVGHWDIAGVIYELGLRREGESALLHDRLLDSRFEYGYRNESLQKYREKVAAAGTPAAHMNLVVALAKMGDWKGANLQLDRVVQKEQRGDSLEDIVGTNRYISASIWDILPGGMERDVERLSLFEIVYLLRDRGWKVYFESMEIGNTGIDAPVEILAKSGLPGQEFIEIKERQVSPQKRGYNFVVIDATTGEIEQVDSFDTWEDRSEGRRMGDFIREIPFGKVVVGTISDEGSGGLGRSAKKGLEMLGGRHLPQYAWRHAIIGVKGSPEGTAIEFLADRAITLAGALRGNIPSDTSSNPEKLRQFLLEATSSIPSGIAVYLSGIEEDSLIAVASR